LERILIIDFNAIYSIIAIISDKQCLIVQEVFASITLNGSDP